MKEKGKKRKERRKGKKRRREDSKGFVLVFFDYL